jgi:hypothetical protein
MKYTYPTALSVALLATAILLFFPAAFAALGNLPLLTFHLAFIWGTLAVVLYADEQGLMWILGRKRVLNERLLEWLHALTGLGLAGLIATGGLLITVGGYGYLAATPAFIIKMVFVVVLVVNGFFISYVNKVAVHRAWSELSDSQRMPLLISGTLSALGWTGAVICGLLLH